YRGNTEVGRTKRKNYKLSNSISALRLKNIKLSINKADSEKVILFPILHFLSGLIAIIALTIFETFYIADGLTSNTSNFGEALSMSSGLVLSIGLVAHATVWLCEMTENKFFKWLISLTIALMVLVAFYTIATLRIQSMRVEDLNVSISPTMFT